ncbi:hypothetical protein [Helicobacter typhlonius]|uniref:hypothetical protein n=1 Tax=Helicobacter typhlonius TaxID=76936 RepID=UPI002FDFDF92
MFHIFYVKVKKAMPILLQKIMGGGGIIKLMLPSLHNMIGLYLKYSTKWLECKVVVI